MSGVFNHNTSFIHNENYVDEYVLNIDSVENLQSLFAKTLQKGTHGFCFSLYEENQKPGDIISESQIIKRLEILKPYTNWIRTFSCTEGNELIPVLAKKMGFKTLVGAWIDKDLKKNSEEIQNLIHLAHQGAVDVAAVGNEVLYRKELEVNELIVYIEEVKKTLKNIPTGYVDAYYEFVNLPDLVESCDLILTNCYPFWEGTPIEHAFQHIQDMYNKVKRVAKDKRIIITETGWPSFGETIGKASPSFYGAMYYFIKVQQWVTKNKIESFYFSSFDEAWKSSSEGVLGAYWGIWDAKGNLKY